MDIRQRAIALAGIYKETCTTEPCEYYTEIMDEYFSDSSFDSVENVYASIASLSSSLGECLEPSKLADMKFTIWVDTPLVIITIYLVCLIYVWE